eukprot:1161028-Pelagomonas_calceolata.AAC.1
MNTPRVPSCYGALAKREEGDSKEEIKPGRMPFPGIFHGWKLHDMAFKTLEIHSGIQILNSFMERATRVWERAYLTGAESLSGGVVGYPSRLASRPPIGWMPKDLLFFIGELVENVSPATDQPDIRAVG